MITDIERIGDESTQDRAHRFEMHNKTRGNTLFNGYDTVRVLANSVGQMLHQHWMHLPVMMMQKLCS